MFLININKLKFILVHVNLLSLVNCNYIIDLIGKNKLVLLVSSLWSVRVVPKFMKRSKVPDYKDKHVFGVPPIVNVQRSGQPLPQSIQQAMRYLRSQCLEKVYI